MEEKTKKTLTTIGWWVVLVLLVVLIVRLWTGGRKNEVRIPEGDWAKLMLVLETVNRDYVDPIDQKSVTEEILPGIMAQLDPHSVYISAKDVQKVLGTLTDENLAPTRSAESAPELMSLLDDDQDAVVCDNCHLLSRSKVLQCFLAY